MSDEGGNWFCSVTTSDGKRVVGNHTSSAGAREAIRRLREPGQSALLRFEYPGRPNVEWDVDKPTLRTALGLRAFRPPHYTGQNIASMLSVDLAQLHLVLRPFEEGELIEVSDRGTERETWHLRAPLGSLDDLFTRATRLGFDLDLPLTVKQP